MALEQSNEGFQYASESHSKTPAVVEKVQALISDDLEQSLQKLASIVGVSEPTMCRITEEDLRYKSYTLKIRQMLSAEATRTGRVARFGSHSDLPTAQI